MNLPSKITKPRFLAKIVNPMIDFMAYIEPKQGIGTRITDGPGGRGKVISAAARGGGSVQPIEAFGVREHSTSTAEAVKAYVNYVGQLWKKISFESGDMFAITGLDAAFAVVEGDYVYLEVEIDTSYVPTSAVISVSDTRPDAIVLDESTPPKQTGFNVILARIVAADDVASGWGISGGLKIIQHWTGNMVMANRAYFSSGGTIAATYPEYFGGAY